MGKKELSQAIRMKLYNGEGSDSDITACQYCGNTSRDSFLIEEILTHGGDTVHEVPFCDDSCKRSFIESLISDEPE